MLGGVAKFPARIKCATLAWKALEKAIAADSTQASVSHSANESDTEETSE
jgi:nitrogen fixation NifU-like protein